MSIPAFDTQKAVKAFKEGGFNDTQAEAVVTTMNDVMSLNFATKADLLATKNDLKNDIDKARSDLQKDTAEKFETLYRHLWVMGTGIVIANVTMVAAVVTLLG